MIFILLLGLVFGIVSLVTIFSLRWNNENVSHVAAVLSAICLFVALGNLYVSDALPDGYEAQQVYEVTEDGVLRESNTQYYQDENGDFYVQINIEEHAKRKYFEFFRKPEFEKVAPPVFKNGNLVMDESDTKDVSSKTAYCVECGNELNAEDNFCAGCGKKVVEEQAKETLK